MSDIQQLLNVPTPWTDPDTGKVYQVTRITQKIKARFTAWLKQRALALAAEMAAMMPTAVSAQSNATLQEQMNAGDYGWAGRIFRKAAKTPEGATMLASLLFGCSPEEMEGLMDRHPKAIVAAVELATAESAPASKPGDDSPNVKAGENPAPILTSTP